MASKKSDCICSRQVSRDVLGVVAEDKIAYNPRCTFHKGPDEGYGYDQWGRPNSKHSKHIGAIGAGVIVGSLLVTIIFLVALGLGAFG